MSISIDWSHPSNYHSWWNMSVSTSWRMMSRGIMRSWERSNPKKIGSIHSFQTIARKRKHGFICAGYTCGSELYTSKAVVRSCLERTNYCRWSLNWSQRSSSCQTQTFCTWSSTTVAEMDTSRWPKEYKRRCKVYRFSHQIKSMSNSSSIRWRTSERNERRRRKIELHYQDHLQLAP